MVIGYGNHIIKKHLDKINENDILIYVDAGCSINLSGQKRFNDYIKMLNTTNNGCISFQLSHTENMYTIQEIFKHFMVEDNGK